MARMSSKVKDGIADLRDSAAETMSDASEMYHEGRTHRALKSMSKRIDAVTDAMDARMDAHEDAMGDRMSAIEGRLSKMGRTSWLVRLFWMAVGAGAGAAAAALLDPDTGKNRRHRLRDQLESTGRDLADEARKRADYAAGQAQGAAVEAAKQRMPEEQLAPQDPMTLRDKIRSEVIGHVDGGSDVVVTVHDQGRVKLKGTVPSTKTMQELCQRVEQIPGVREVEPELTVTTV